MKMKHKLAKILFALAITVLSIGFSRNTEEVQAQIAQASDGNWYYYNNGKIDKTFTGLDYNQYGWWYVKNGKVDFTYTGAASNKYGEWYVKNGKVTLGFTGIADLEDAQFCIINGRVARDYYGLFYYNGDWWNIKAGEVKDDFYDHAPVIRGDTKWYVNNGKVDFSFTGVSDYYAERAFFKNGRLYSEHIGLVKCSDQKWRYNDHGRFASNNFYELVQNEYGWWAVYQGVVDFSYNGLISNKYGTWYIKNGKVDFGYTGQCTVNEKIAGTNKKVTYNVVNGKVQYKYDKNASDNAYKWYMKNGKVDYSFNGMAQFSDGWYKVENGHVDRHYSGLVQKGSEWWLIINGKADFSKNEVVFDGKNYWWVEDGKVNFNRSRIVYIGPDTGYLIVNGKADFTYNGFYMDGKSKVFLKDGIYSPYVDGLVKSNNKWIYIKQGNYCAGSWIVSNEYGRWFAEDGEVDFTCNVMFTEHDVYTGIEYTYTVRNGQVVSQVAR